MCKFRLHVSVFSSIAVDNLRCLLRATYFLLERVLKLSGRFLKHRGRSSLFAEKLYKCS